MDIRALEGAKWKSIGIFCCYAHEDQRFLIELKKHLYPLLREGLITLWADVDINAGKEWEEEVHRHLNTAQIILLLISSDFMASEYCYSIEMRQALERHELGEARVIPIILRSVSWKRTPIGKLQALPKDAEPITSRKWRHQDDAFCYVAEGIRDAVEALVIRNSDLEVHSPDQVDREVAGIPFSPNPRVEEKRVFQGEEGRRRQVEKDQVRQVEEPSASTIGAEDTVLINSPRRNVALSEYQDPTMGGIRNQGQQVPVVAFYSVQGGVGKTTVARKFAELVTVAPGREGRKPNVLLVDLDVDSQGLTFRMANSLRPNFRTVHEVLVERNVAVAQAINVTNNVSLASGNPKHHGELYLMPAAPPEAKGLFSTLATIDKQELFRLLRDLITALVIQYDISCVVIDCAPGTNPYAAAAASLADVPFLIGRNDPVTYEQIRLIPERFREWYGQFQPAKQRVIINAVALRDLYDERAKQYAVFDYLPLATDVILDTEGLSRTGSMQMLLFEKYIVDIIKRVFVGKKYLIPEAPEILGLEWIEMLNKLNYCEAAPKVRRLRLFRHVSWVGAALVVIGIALIGAYQVFGHLPATLTTIGIVSAIAGIFLIAGGWYAESRRQRILTTTRELVLGGPDEVFRWLRKGASQRKKLEEMKKLADTIPAEAWLQQAETPHRILIRPS